MREKQRRKCPKFLNQFQCGYRYCLILEVGRIFCFKYFVLFYMYITFKLLQKIKPREIDQLSKIQKKETARK